jgi:hypothetical protein
LQPRIFTVSFGRVLKFARLGPIWPAATGWIRSISSGPPDLSDEDRQRYFEPIALTDASGAPAEWLKPYMSSRRRA